MRGNGQVKRIILAVAAAVLLLTGALNVRSVIGGSDNRAWDADPSQPSAADALVGAPVRLPSKLDDQIGQLQDTLRADPNNGQAATLLGQAYLQKTRETGDPSYYPKAETLFAKALKRNDLDFAAAAGMGTLALARHQFTEGLTWGERSRALNPHYPPAFGVIGDAEIELGRYDDAVKSFQQMVDLRPDLTSLSRVSYARELLGDVDGAIKGMQRAATAGAGIPENVAWTQAQLGNLFFSRGDLAGAERQYERSLVTLDGYVYGLAGQARVAAARGDFDQAIALYTRAIQTMPLPEFVIALGDVEQAAGKPDQAAQQYALVDVMAQLYQRNGVDTDVEMALFDADHDRNLDAALRKARAGFEKRPSIKTADVLAWTLYKTGNDQEAATASRQALRLGTKDALMHFHAGMIEAKLGHRDAAIAHLQQALAINPYFSVLYAGQARTTLARLQTGA